MQDEVKVREIETVAGDFLTEAGVPFYRVEIDGFCADFDYREAAENFANAINQMVARHRHQAERETLARMEPVAWQRRRKFALASDPAGKVYQWEQCSAREATGHFEREAGCEYRALYTLPPAPEAGQ